MRGFPIIGIARITSSTQTTPPKDSFMVIPKFVCDEYYLGNEAATINSYKNYYLDEVSLDYVKSVTIKENNINLTSGTQTSVTYSSGFSGTFYGTNGSYGIFAKLMQIRNIRIDSFYCSGVGYQFFATHVGLQNIINTLNNLYINMPNSLSDGSQFALNIPTMQIESISLNMPKHTLTNGLFLNNDTKTENLYLNLGNFNNMGQNKNNFAAWNGNVNVYSLKSSAETTRLINLFNSNKAPGCTATFINAGTCSLSEFDIRYWDLWQNTTGKDSGLH